MTSAAVTSFVASVPHAVPLEDPATVLVKLQRESETGRHGVPSVRGGIGFTSGAMIFGLAARGPSREARVTTYVYNSAQVPARVLMNAEALAARMFEKAGISVVWIAGLTSRRPPESPPVEKWNPDNLVLRIWQSSTLRGKGFDAEALGFCLSMETREAVVLFDKIQDRAAMLNIDPAIPLGVSMAHEMGHMLLKSAAHALSGVMKARWLAEDLTAAESGTLAFTREEGDFMRNGLRLQRGIQNRQE